MAAAISKFEIGTHVGNTTALVGLVLITTPCLSVTIFLRIQGILREYLRKQLYNTAAEGIIANEGQTLLGLIVIAAVITALLMLARIILFRWINAPSTPSR